MAAGSSAVRERAEGVCAAGGDASGSGLPQALFQRDPREHRRTSRGRCTSTPPTGRRHPRRSPRRGGSCHASAATRGNRSIRAWTSAVGIPSSPPSSCSRATSMDADDCEIEQPAPSQVTDATRSPSTSTRSVISSPQIGLRWCTVALCAPGSARPKPRRFFAWSRMSSWYSDSSPLMRVLRPRRRRRTRERPRRRRGTCRSRASVVWIAALARTDAVTPKRRCRGLRAVVSHADGDPAGVEELPHVVRVDTLDDEGLQGDALRGIRVSEQADAVDRAEPLAHALLERASCACAAARSCSPSQRTAAARATACDTGCVPPRNAAAAGGTRPRRG